MKSKTLYWCNPWAALTILLNVPIHLIVYLAIRKKVIVAIPLSPGGKAILRKHAFIAIGLGVAGVAAIIIGIAQVDRLASLIALGFILLLTGLIYGLFKANALRVAKIKNGEAWITGACPEFLETLPEYSAGRESVAASARRRNSTENFAHHHVAGHVGQLDLIDRRKAHRVGKFPDDLLVARNFKNLRLLPNLIVAGSIAHDRVSVRKSLKARDASQRVSRHIIFADFPHHLEVSVEFLQFVRIAQGQKQMTVRQAQDHPHIAGDGNSAQRFSGSIKLLNLMLAFATNKKMALGSASHAAQLIANRHVGRRGRQPEFLQDVAHVIDLNNAARTILHDNKMSIGQWLA